MSEKHPWRRAIAAISLVCAQASTWAGPWHFAPFDHLPSADELFDWAERHYPSVFPGHASTSTLPPYRYRFYPATGNYLGVAGGDVYLLGPVSGGPLVKFAGLADIACWVFPAECPPDEAGYFRLLGVTGAATQRLLAFQPRFYPTIPFDPSDPVKVSGLQPLPEGKDLEAALTPSPPRLATNFSHAYARNATNGRAYLGAAGYYYVAGGRLFRVDLARTQAPAAVQVSALDTACSVSSVVPIDDSAQDAWVYLVEAGADRNCSTTGDNGHVLVRSGTPATQAPQLVMPPLTSQANGRRILPGAADGSQVLRDAQGRLQWFGGYEVNGTTTTWRLFAAQDLASGPADPTHASVFGLHPTKPGTGYANVDGTVRRISWSAQGTQLGEPVYASEKDPAAAAMVTEDALYAVYGNQIVRFPDSGPGQVVATLPHDPLAGSAASRLASVTLAQTPSRIVMAAVNGHQQVMAIYAMPKGGGTLTSLVSAQTESGFIRFLGTQGEQLAFATDLGGLVSPSPPLSQPRRLSLISADGSGKAVLEASAPLVGTLEAQAPKTLGDRLVVLPEIASIVYCANALKAGCGGASLVEYRLLTRPETPYVALGGLGGVAGVLLVTGDGVDGLPMRLRVDAAEPQLWTALPNLGGSMMRVNPPSP